MTTLVDSSVLIGLAIDDHEHHGAAAHWFMSGRRDFATCPTVQGALVRHTLRNGRPAEDAIGFLAALTQLPTHHFWPNDVSYADISTAGIRGHRQVTDAYLAELARRRRGRVATFDKGLAVLHADVAELVPTA